jgi:pyruvate dehydrogenase E1 component alpha subunit
MNKQDLINFENRIVELYKDCRLPFLFHLSGGNEDQLIDIFKDIKEGDYVLSSHRNHYHALLHGIPPKELEQKIIDGKSMFVYDRKRNFFTSAIIGGTPAIAAGIALALKKKKSSQKVWCFVGDGTEDNGHLFEAARYVSGFDLPCTFIVEDNNRSVCTTKEERWGKSGYPIFPPCVHRYQYDITYPHCRVDAMIDLSKTRQKKDEEYFPYLRTEVFPAEPWQEVKDRTISYKQAINQAMDELGKRDNTIFIGYNIKPSQFGDAGGSLKTVDNSKKIETPVAENLMTGLGIGMSFEGYKPIVYYERHDFMLVAADSIGNHINHIERLSQGEYKVPIILRSVVADSGVFYSGPTHSQDFTNVLRELVDFPVLVPENGAELLEMYRLASISQRPIMIVEKKSLF